MADSIDIREFPSCGGVCKRDKYQENRSEEVIATGGKYLCWMAAEAALDQQGEVMHEPSSKQLGIAYGYENTTYFGAVSLCGSRIGKDKCPDYRWDSEAHVPVAKASEVE